MAKMAELCDFVPLRFRWIYVASVALVLLCGIQESLSARGVRIGGGFRSSSSRYSVRTSPNVRYVSHSTRVRVRYNNYRPWRSWHSYGSSGYIYGYVYYTRSRNYHLHRDREPTICRNEYDNLMDNGTNYEWFICPNITSPDNYDACCGDEDRQHCCQKELNGLRVFGIFVAAFILLLGVVLTIYCCCCRKPPGRETYFKQRFMSKHQAPPSAAVHYRPDPTGKLGNTSEITHLMNPPMQGPQPSFPQNEQPGYPPSTQPMYPPQPVSNPSGYPPSGELGACTPYPSYPGAPSYPALDQPLYPIQPPLSDQLGYPPSASAPPYPPYPTDGSSAPPYPPYPTDGNSAPPYPPYPTSGNSAPYPPYPADGSAAHPYPPQPAAYNPPGYTASPPPTYSSLN